VKMECTCRTWLSEPRERERFFYWFIERMWAVSTVYYLVQLVKNKKQKTENEFSICTSKFCDLNLFMLYTYKISQKLLAFEMCCFLNYYPLRSELDNYKI